MGLTKKMLIIRILIEKYDSINVNESASVVSSNHSSQMVTTTSIDSSNVNTSVTQPPSESSPSIFPSTRQREQSDPTKESKQKARNIVDFLCYVFLLLLLPFYYFYCL